MIEAELTKPQWGISAATAVAARVLAGLEQRQVAAKAKIDASTLHRMEASEDKPTRGHAANVERVVEVLRKAGVEMTNEAAQRPAHFEEVTSGITEGSNSMTDENERGKQ